MVVRACQRQLKAQIIIVNALPVCKLLVLRLFDFT